MRAADNSPAARESARLAFAAPPRGEFVLVLSVGMSGGDLRGVGDAVGERKEKRRVQFVKRGDFDAAERIAHRAAEGVAAEGEGGGVERAGVGVVERDVINRPTGAVAASKSSKPCPYLSELA